MRLSTKFFDGALSPRHLGFWTLLASIATVVTLIVTLILAAANPSAAPPALSAPPADTVPITASTSAPAATSTSTSTPTSPSTTTVSSRTSVPSSRGDDTSVPTPRGGVTSTGHGESAQQVNDPHTMFGAGSSPCSAPASAKPAVAGLAIDSPRDGDTIGTLNTDGIARQDVWGTATLTDGEALWVFLFAADICRYYVENVQPEPLAVDDAGQWWIRAGLAYNEKGPYVLYAVAMSAADNQRLVDGLQKPGNWPGWVYQLPPGARSAHIAVTCCL
jgi:hypothetical protein